MIDIEFLTQLPTMRSGVVIYRCKTGALRRMFTGMLESAAAQAGETVVRYEPQALKQEWRATSLYDGIRICDLFASGRNTDKQLTQDLMELATVQPLMPTVLLVPATRMRVSATQNDQIVIVDEAVVSAANLGDVLEFLARHYELPIEAGRHPSQAIRTYFAGCLQAEGGRLDMQSFLIEYDRAALLYTNDPQASFVAPPYAEQARDGRSYVVRSVDAYLSAQTRNNEADLLRAFAMKAERGWSCRELADELCRATYVRVDREIRRDSASAARSVALWGLLVLSCTAAFYDADGGNEVTSGDFLISLERLVRLYGANLDKPYGDQSPGLCRGADRVIRQIDAVTDPDDTLDQRSQLLNALRQLVGHTHAPGWPTRIRSLLCGSGRPADRSTEIEPIGYGFPPLRAFSDIIGQRALLDRVRRRFEGLAPNRPLVLVGPPGTGKRSVARLYAKALLCEQRVGIEPCCRCASCRDFDASGGFGYITIDLGHPDGKDHVNQHVHALRQVSLADHRVIVLLNADATDVAIDAFLKPFEDGAYKTSFIVLATDENEIRSAVVSRSDTVRLKQLDEADASALLAHQLTSFPCDNDTVKLIRLIGHGIPGDLLRAANIIRSANAVTLNQAKAALSLDWGEPILSFWSGVFEGKVERRTLNELVRQSSVREVVSRAGAVLKCLIEGDSASELALFGLQESFSDVMKGSRQGMSDNGGGLSSSCASLLALWLDEDVVDEEGLFELAQQTISRR